MSDNVPPAQFTRIGQLLDYLQLNKILDDTQIDLQTDFSLRVPLSFVQRMQPGNIDDPLLRQVLPLREEKRGVKGFSPSPLQEQDYQPLPGLIHKYPQRILLMPSESCSIHCRYCFRRHFSYAEQPDSLNMDRQMQWIANHTDIHEVILSGGDPMVLSDRRLLQIIHSLNAIPHLQRLRIHTRELVVNPQRITDELINCLKISRVPMVIVIHTNHPQEIDAGVAQQLFKLRQACFTLLNQSVLLKGVNDDAQVLAQLSEKLFNAGILPYYLHRLDPVSGSHHFALERGEIQLIYTQLQALLPGYLLPRLVQEEPGKKSKTLLGI